MKNEDKNRFRLMQEEPRRLFDTEIVDLFLKREESAITHCKRNYGPQLLSMARRITESEQTAEECESDTYLTAWESIPPHEPRTYLFAFLAKIIRQRSLDACRRNRAGKRYALVEELTAELQQCIPDGAQGPEESFEEQQFLTLVKTFLLEQTEESRMIFLRRYFYGDPVAEIASHLGCTESKVKTNAFRTRQRLQEYLQKEGYVR